MLWIELAGGIAPIIYTSNRCLKLVPKEHLIARYALPEKPLPIRRLKERPDKYQHAELIRQCLLAAPDVVWLQWVQRKRLRRIVLRNIQQSIVETIADDGRKTDL